MQDSQIATLPGTGTVSPKALAKLAGEWGHLPPKERAKKLAELTQKLPPNHRELIERYFKQIAEAHSSTP
jgi:acyl-CoA reductase-like NAD-dependent aldehyde dehydrogenase